MKRVRIERLAPRPGVIGVLRAGHNPDSVPQYPVSPLVRLLEAGAGTSRILQQQANANPLERVSTVNATLYPKIPPTLKVP